MGTDAEARVRERVLAPMLRDAVALAAAGVATAVDIDLAMRLGARHREGPLTILAGLTRGEAEALLGEPPPSWASVSVDGAAPASDDEPEGGVTVVGSGFMGAGIAYVAVVAGVPTTLLARSAAAGERARAAVRRDLDGAVARERLTAAQADAAAARLTIATDASDGIADRLVIESVAEDLALKRQLFAELEQITASDALLTTNTSSLRVAEIAAATRCPERVAGLHFFSPVAAMRLVEVIVPESLPDATVAALAAWARRLRKVPVRSADRSGFIVNRLLFPMLNDAVRTVDEGLFTVEEVDELLPLVGGHPIGPLALLDLIGLDISLAAEEVLAAANPGDARLAPADGLRRRVAAGRLGRKTGRGFHDYLARPDEAARRRHATSG
ncbi:MAG: 3-hydroxyacyl-CoA dehydrogenase family protein [Solirubrobacterales bacterium]|nr:3-hydroxyacyl-CoA dehydrogenase family protein [Solirubrobacterales bacterium]